MSNPYYQDEFVTLYNCDISDMPSIVPAESVDVVFADPPFNVGLSYDGDRDRRENYYTWQDGWVANAFDVLSGRGTFYLMTITRHLPSVFASMSACGTFVSQIIWKNVSGVGSKRYYWRQYQPIVMYAKTPDYYFNTYAVRRDSGFRRWGGYSTQYQGQLGDIWDDIPFVYAGSIRHREVIVESGTNKKAHPAQMPEALAYRMISFSCPPDGVVLDMFSGSGTFLRVAKDLQVKAIGFEQSERYCELIASRLRQPRIPTPLLDESEPSDQLRLL